MNIPLDMLPLEVLLHIVSYVPNKKNLALVSKTFYDAVWRFDAPHLIIKYSVFSPNPELIKQVVKTRREIRRFRLEFLFDKKEFMDVKNFLQRIGKDVKYLKVRTRPIEKFPNNFQQILMMLPNLKSLEIKNFYWDFDIQTMIEIVDYLKYRKALNCVDDIQSYVLEEAFIPFRQGASRGILEFFVQNIKLLELKFCLCMHFFDIVLPDFDTSSWSSSSERWKYYGPIIVTYDRSKLIRFTCYDGMTDECLAAIVTNFADLKELEITTKALSLEGFKCVSRLKSIEKMTLIIKFESRDKNFLQAFSNFDNNRILSLQLNMEESSFFLPATFTKLAQSVPNLRSLKLCMPQYIDWKTFHLTIGNLVNFKSICRLGLHNVPNDPELTFRAMDQLKKLRFDASFDGKWNISLLTKLKQGFPNIEVLFLYVTIISDSTTLKSKEKSSMIMSHVLKSWPNLKHFTLLSTKLSVDEMKIFLEMKNLRYLKIEIMENFNIEEIKEIFEEKFGVIKVKSGKLVMAIDLATIRRAKCDFKRCNCNPCHS